MKGDFTRNTFDPFNHFTRVLMQQGRVQVDADWNEQTSILLHFLRTLARDLFGPAGGPVHFITRNDEIIEKGPGYEILTKGIIENDSQWSDEQKQELLDLLNSSKAPFLISKGHYYVNGYLCSNEDFLPFNEQPDFPVDEEFQIEGDNSLVYLDVWELHQTYHQFPSMREIALGGPDTASRAKLLSQVKVHPGISACPDMNSDTWLDLSDKWQPQNRGMLKAQAKKPQVNDNDPCDIAPESQYRGPENQLYRVEIHTPGEAGTATFKWSRDNGSVVYAIRSLKGEAAVVYDLGADDRSRLQPGQWVEIVDDDKTRLGERGNVLQVEDVDPVENLVTLIIPEGEEQPFIFDEDETDDEESKHPLLRRWDTLPNAEKADMIISESEWKDIEDGIQIYFETAEEESAHQYRTGDYWLIPARTESGDVLWPKQKGSDGIYEPVSRKPDGIEHQYAPLGILAVASGVVSRQKDCRKICALQCIQLDFERKPLDDKSTQPSRRGTQEILEKAKQTTPEAAKKQTEKKPPKPKKMS